MMGLKFIQTFPQLKDALYNPLFAFGLFKHGFVYEIFIGSDCLILLVLLEAKEMAEVEGTFVVQVSGYSVKLDDRPYLKIGPLSRGLSDCTAEMNNKDLFSPPPFLRQ